MGQIQIGEKFHVFSDQDDRYFLHNPKLIVSADGVANGNRFEVDLHIRRVSFYFMGGMDPAARLRVFATGRPPHELEGVDGGHHGPDYTLSKFQRQGGETYEDIDWNVQHLVAKARRVAELQCDNDPLADDWTQPFDVLTVRHRPLMRNPTLSEALAALKDAKRLYTTVHCLFH